MKIALIGYGKMGRMIEEIALSRGHEIVSIIDIDNREDFDSDAFRSADVAIEFTAPQAAYDNYLRAWQQGVKVVSGSTGWMAEHGDDVRKATSPNASEGGELYGKTLFWASNFSVGVAIFSAVNKYLAKIMNRFPQYDPHMEETHHIHKLDAPSGTTTRLRCVWTRCAVARCRASTPSAMTPTPTASPSATMPIRAEALPWVDDFAT